MNQYKTSRSTNDALSLPALKGGVSRAKAMKIYHNALKNDILMETPDGLVVYKKAPVSDQ